MGEGSGDDGRGTDVESVQNTWRQQFIEKLPRPRRTSPRISSPVLHVNSSYEVQLATTSNSARLVPRDFSSECQLLQSSPSKTWLYRHFWLFFFYTETVHRPADGGVSYCSTVGSARMARRRGFSEELSRNQKEENHGYLFGDKSFNRIKPYPPFHLSLLTHSLLFFLSFFHRTSFASTPPCAYN